MLNLTESQWNHLFDKADETIVKIINEFPYLIKQEADKIPCLLDTYSPDGHILGMYCPASKGPIWIYVGQIYEDCKENIEETMKSVQQVYLHEFAHHFDLMEYEVKERGL